MSEFAKFQAAVCKKHGLQKIKAVHNPNYQRHGLKSYVKTMSRWGFQPTKPGAYFCQNRMHQRGLAGGHHATGGRVRMRSELVKRVAAANGSGTSANGAPTGEVGADDQQNDVEYTCPVQIGTPAQTLNLDFDTGSSDLWVFSDKTPTTNVGKHNVFQSAKSSTFKAASNESWNISYGDGSSASGTVGTDVVSLGGLAIKNQAIELASQLSAQFAQGNNDGLLGLAWPSINTVSPKPVATPVQNMIDENIIKQDVFTVALYKSSDADKSFYTFGFIDTELAPDESAIQWTAVDNSQGFWQFPAASTKIADQAVDQSGNTAIADTGTTLCMLSDKVVEALYGQIEGATYNEQQQGYVIPASTTSMPAFQLPVGDAMVTLDPEDLKFQDLGDGTFYGGVQSRGDMTFDIYGDVFLKSVYAIYDQGQARFGVVQKTSTGAANSA